MFRNALPVMCLFFSGASFAISNIENSRPGLPDKGWSGGVKLGLDGKTGNKQEQDYLASAKVVYRQGNRVALAIAEREYGNTRNIKDTDEAFVHARYVQILKKYWAVETFAQWEEDEFAYLESRSLLGAGGRILAVEEPKKFSLSIGLGAFREREHLDLQTYESIRWTTRMNTYYSYKHQFNDQVRLNSSAYFQPSIQDASNIRGLFDISLLVKIVNGVHIQLKYDYKYDSNPAQNFDIDPPINNDKVDTRYSTSLVYEF